MTETSDFRSAAWLDRFCRIPAIRALPFVVALAFRLLHVDGDFIRMHHWNEGHYACATRNVSRFGPFDQRDDLGVDRTFSPLVPDLMWPTARLAGWRPWGFRLPLVVASLIGLAALKRVARRDWRLAEHEAWLGLFFCAVAPGVAYFSRNIQLDGVATCLLFLALLGVGSASASARAWGWAAWAACLLAKTSFGVFYPAAFLTALGAPGADGKKGRRVAVVLAASVVAALPIAAWIVMGLAEQPESVAAFMNRAGGRSWGLTMQSLKTLPSVFAHDLGVTPLSSLSLAGGLPAAFGLAGAIVFLAGRRFEPRRHLAALWIMVGWVVFCFSHPLAFMHNQYYVYPALCLIAMLGGVGGGALARWAARSYSPLGVAWAMVAILLAATPASLASYEKKQCGVKKTIAAMIKAGNPLPFRLFSDKRPRLFASLPLLAREAPSGGPILVDYPAAMFHGGAEPDRWRCAYGDVSEALDPARDKGVYLGFMRPVADPAAFEARLRALGWRQVAPDAWVALR
jgi:4-amino-4-deoxy-L-arabinose transferase-like glycosyltransferase